MDTYVTEEQLAALSESYLIQLLRDVAENADDTGTVQNGELMKKTQWHLPTLHVMEMIHKDGYTTTVTDAGWAVLGLLEQLGWHRWLHSLGMRLSEQ